MTDGSDIIFAVGAPGSKWSRILTVLGMHPDINTSDYEKFPTYGSRVTFNNGKTRRVGVHTGAYFGPGNQVGENFDNLASLSKEEFLNEIMPCFDNWHTGFKIIKSHWFAYNIDWLTDNFPKAKIILVYNGDDEAFKWWHLVGGWNISFPNYSWYKDDIRMWQQLQKENAHIIDFMRSKKLSFDVTTLDNLAARLELPLYKEFLDTLQVQKDDDPAENIVRNNVGSCVAVYDPAVSGNKNIDQDLAKINEVLTKRAQSLAVDELLINLYGEEWLNTINSIMSERLR